MSTGRIGTCWSPVKTSQRQSRYTSDLQEVLSVDFWWAGIKMGLFEASQPYRVYICFACLLFLFDPKSSVLESWFTQYSVLSLSSAAFQWHLSSAVRGTCEAVAILLPHSFWTVLRLPKFPLQQMNEICPLVLNSLDLAHRNTSFSHQML